MMKTIRIDSAVVICACMGTLFIGGMWTQQEKIDACQQDLAHERELREQAQNIEYKLIQEAADEWCGDTLEDSWQELRRCEERGENERPSIGCNDCWEAWALDMEGTCRSMTYDFESKLEDSILFNSAKLLWEDYAAARTRDCESRKFKTVQEFDKCLGPAARQKEIEQAFEAMFIHQQSKAF